MKLISFTHLRKSDVESSDPKKRKRDIAYKPEKAVRESLDQYIRLQKTLSFTKKSANHTSIEC